MLSHFPLLTHLCLFLEPSFPVGFQAFALKGRPAVAAFAAPCPEDSDAVALIREDN